MIIRIPIGLLAAVLISALSACGGSSQLERSSSARGIIVSKPGTSCGQAGRNSVIYFYDDGSSSASGWHHTSTTRPVRRMRICASPTRRARRLQRRSKS